MVFPFPMVPLINVERPIRQAFEGWSVQTLNARGGSFFTSWDELTWETWPDESTVGGEK